MSYTALASASRVRAAADGAWPAIALGFGVAPVLAANGGYFPSSWGWAGVALAWAAVLAAALADVKKPTGLQLAFVGGLAAFAGWIALSLMWTSTASETNLEFDRMLVYVAGALAVVTIVGAERVTRLLGGVLAGIVVICGYALSTRVFPHGAEGGFAGSRLASPIGYWNGLGLIAGMGAVLALVFAARARSAFWRGVATACIPLLLTTLYFTFGRGAWLALFVGVVVLFAADHNRLQLVGPAIVGGVLGMFAVWRASQAGALTHTSAESLQTAIHQGRGLAAVVAGACLVAGYGGWLAGRFDHVWETRQAARAARWGLVGIVALAAIVAVARYGSPVSMVQRAYDSFVAQPPSGASASTNLNNRLFSLSNDGRLPAWKVAWHAFTAHPAGGVGAGGFENYWNQHRTFDEKIRDAHNFYLETLAEDGIFGFAILMAALALPLVAFRRVRGGLVAAGALAAYSMFLVHAFADWDWELSGVTLCALFCGGAILASSRSDAPAGRWRWPALGLSSVVGLLALAGLAGQLLLNASAGATRSSDWGTAKADARHAHWVLPFSSEPWQRLAEAQRAEGQRAAAVASLQKAIAQSPGDYTLWVELAKAQTGDDRYTSFAQAMKLNPLGADDVRTIVQQLLNGPNGGSS